MQEPLSTVFPNTTFFEVRLKPETAPLAKGFDAVCIFVSGLRLRARAGESLVLPPGALVRPPQQCREPLPQKCHEPLPSPAYHCTRPTLPPLGQ